MQAQTKPRRRYSPEVRRSMILDQTADIIAREGVAGLSMELIAQNAGVSKSLVYNYFDSLTDLLKELLERELRALRLLQFKAAEKATTFEELVRGVTHEYLDYIDRRGLIIERLQAEPSVSEAQDPTQYDRNSSVDYLAPIVSKQFDMPIELARAATDISFGLPASAGEYLLRTKMDLKELEDLTVSMIIGSIAMVRTDFLTRKQKLKR